MSRPTRLQSGELRRPEEKMQSNRSAARTKGRKSSLPPNRGDSKKRTLRLQSVSRHGPRSTRLTAGSQSNLHAWFGQAARSRRGPQFQRRTTDNRPHQGLHKSPIGTAEAGFGLGRIMRCRRLGTTSAKAKVGSIRATGLSCLAACTAARTSLVSQLKQRDSSRWLCPIIIGELSPGKL